MAASPPRPSPPPPRAGPASGGGPTAAPATMTATTRSVPGRLIVGAVDRFDAALLTLLALALGAMACVAMAQVVARYVLQQPLVWSEELMRYALIWLAFLGAGVGVRKGMLVSVEIVVHLVPEPVRRLALWLSVLCSAAFWTMLIVYGIQILGSVQGMRSGAMELPMSYVYLAVPVGAAIALVNTLVVAVDPPSPRVEGGPGS